MTVSGIVLESTKFISQVNFKMRRWKLGDLLWSIFPCKRFFNTFSLQFLKSILLDDKIFLRSVLLGDNVVSNGSLILLVPINPALLLLPYLRKYAKVIFYGHLLK